ncbi:hypothetical protein HIM_03615 [Hirsutella minnesotensis 3608]|uniref:NACHT-NTPase and P-loop NTPases N-terminal domain-containing protein n=1 Tax=Hirsutella minnesotensis 3608 TaxID=1043627 RepID=A0A0F8A6L6_9HYPO|nr:hypothetical protein HIM_03615 [Hirsutella minnesotensis 3608]
MATVGFGAGDFIALPTFALKVYHFCRDAPEDFRDLATQVKALSQIIQDATRIVSTTEIDETCRAQGLWFLKESETLLKEVEEKVAKFKTTNSGRLAKRDYLRSILEDVSSLKSRIQGNSISLTAYLQTVVIPHPIVNESVNDSSP